MVDYRLSDLSVMAIMQKLTVSNFPRQWFVDKHN